MPPTQQVVGFRGDARDGAQPRRSARDRAQLVVFANQAGLVRPGWAG